MISNLLYTLNVCGQLSNVVAGVMCGVTMGVIDPAPLTLSRYDPHVFEATVSWRVEHGTFPEQSVVDIYDGFVATGSCEYVGDTTVVLVDDETQQIKILLVSDCASRTDQSTQDFMEYIDYEVDYNTAVSLGWTTLTGRVSRGFYVRELMQTKDEIAALRQFLNSHYFSNDVYVNSPQVIINHEYYQME